jgi:DNA-binding PucR family transcriptional regulator
MTAAVYFTTNMNPALTAKRLDIHRNTIDYRINRLKELFDIRFDDNETTFSFEMSFRILRFLGLPPFNAVG